MSEKKPTQETTEIPQDDQQAEQAEVDQADSSAKSGEEDADNTPDPRVAELEEALAKARENEVRAVAEQENTRRRAEADVQKAHKFGTEKLINGLLPVIDNLERALKLMDAGEENTVSAVFEGIELTYKEFIGALEKQGVVTVDPQSEPFNPEHHQAISAIENPDVEPNSVVEVIQKGYLLNDRLLRPALVIVSKSSG